MTRLKFMSTYFNFCTEQNLRPCDVVVSAGGALLMLGLRNSTSDLDVDIPSHDYDRLLKASKVGERVSSHGAYLDVTDVVSVHRIPDGIVPIRVFGVWIYPLEKLIEQKTKLSIAHDRPVIKAEQDLLDIQNLKVIMLDFVALN